MKTTKTQFISFACLLSLTCCGFAVPEAELTVRVVDEDRQPIEGAQAGAWFPGIYGAGAPAEGESVKSMTDADGISVLKGRPAAPVGGGAEKAGYYRTQFGKVDFQAMQQRGEKLTTHREVVLKEIKNPIPMCARWLRELVVPLLNTPIGFDLEAGDWVTPHGQGKKTDVVFAINGHYNSYNEFDATLDITFPNEGDGLIEFSAFEDIGSKLRSSHLAPEQGYEPLLSLSKRALRGQSSSKWLNESQPGSNYYLRVRTVLDEKGNVVQANYGKIYGPFDFRRYPEKDLFITAQAYYFNPTVNDRNVEFDTKRNLATLKSREHSVNLP